MDRKKKLPLAGFQIKKKPVEEEKDDTLIKLYEESELLGENAEKQNNNKKPKKTKKTKHKRDDDKIAKASKIIKRLTITVAVLGVLGVFAFLLFRPNIDEKTLEGVTSGTQADQIYYSRLTGREISKEKLNATTTCIMIENSPDARPQSGLDEAGVVYEAIAEGGITRFMAIFQEAKPQYIGPVRSLRMTYAEFAKPYNCSIAHVGGSQNALDLVRNNEQFRDIDQFFNDQAYWRINSRWAPHNVYTSFNSLDNLNQSLGYTSSEFNGFKHSRPDTNKEINPTPVTNIRIQMSSNVYNVVYNYDQEKNNYKRSFEYGGPHEVVSEAGIISQLAPDVVIALETNPVARSGSSEGYADYRTTGEGNATIFQNGNVITAKWQRASVDDELKFIDDSGTEVELNRGQVWISIYPSGNSVSWE